MRLFHLFHDCTQPLIVIARSEQNFPPLINLNGLLDAYVDVLSLELNFLIKARKSVFF